MDPKETILKALDNYRSDDLYRARAAFRHYTTEQMNSRYGRDTETGEPIRAAMQVEAQGEPLDPKKDSLS